MVGFHSVIVLIFRKDNVFFVVSLMILFYVVKKS